MGWTWSGQEPTFVLYPDLKGVGKPDPRGGSPGSPWLIACSSVSPAVVGGLVGLSVGGVCALELCTLIP